MSISLAVAIYFIIWWVTLFAVLPIGLRTQEEDGDVVPGTPESAPARPRLLRIVAINTMVASVVFVFVASVIVFKWLPIEHISIPRLG